MSDGTVDYDVTVGANTKNLEKSIDRVIKSIERLEDTLSGGQSHIQKSLNASTKAFENMAAQTKKFTDKQRKSVEKFNTTFKNLAGEQVQVFDASMKQHKRAVISFTREFSAKTAQREKIFKKSVEEQQRIQEKAAKDLNRIQNLHVKEFLKGVKQKEAADKRAAKEQADAEKRSAKEVADAFTFRQEQIRKQIKEGTKAAERAAKEQSDAQRNLQQAMARSSGRLEDIESKYQDVIKVASRMGDTAAIRKAEQDMASYRDALNRGFNSSQDFTNATSEISQQMRRMRNEANKFESEMAKFVRSTRQAARSTDTINEQLKAMGASSEDVRRTMTPLNRGLQRYQRALRDAGDDSVAIARAQADFAASTDRARREVRDLNDTLRRNRRETDRARDGVENLSGAMGALVASTGAFVSAYNLIEIARMADRYTEMSNRLYVVSDATANVAEDMRTMMQVAIDTRSSLDGVTDVFSKLTRANDRYGKSQEEILKITTAVSQAVSMSGATAQGAEGALIQFSQAISNNFQAAAQEINSINEQTPALSDAIALALTSVGKYGEVARADLKRLASEGRLSAGDLLDGFVNVADEIEARFETATATMAQGFENFKDSAVISIGEVGRATGITEKIAKALQDLAKQSEEAAAGISGIAAAAAALAGSIGIAGIVGLGTIMGPLAVKIALVGTAVSALVGVFVAAKAETALFEQKMADLDKEIEAVRNSMFGMANDKYEWEDSSFSAWLKDSNDSIKDTRDEIEALEEDILRLSELDGNRRANGTEIGLRPGPSRNDQDLDQTRVKREKRLEEERILLLEQAVELAKRFNDERFGRIDELRDKELRTIVETNDKRLTGLAAFKEEAEDFYRFLSNNADKDLLDTRRMQLGKDLLKGIGIEAEDMGMLVSDNTDIIDAAITMLAKTAASPAEVFEFLKNNIDKTNTSLAESELEIRNLYEGMNNATGVTAAFSAEVARLGSIMVTAAAAGNTEMVGMIREIIIEMNKQYNANIEATKQVTSVSATSASSRISDAEREAEARKKSVESIINNIQGMTLEQDRAKQSLQELKTGGISAMEDLEKSFEIDDTIKSLVDEYKALDKAGKALLIQELDEHYRDITVTAENYVSVIRDEEEDTLALVDAKSKLIEAEQELQGIVEGAIGRSKDLEDRMAAMTNIGIDASQIKNVRTAVESFEKLGDGAQREELERLRQQFPELTWEVETFGNSIEQVFHQNNAVEDWADTVEDVGNRIGSTLEETIKGALDGSINSFSDAADRLKDMMKQLLIDLAYQAAIEHIVVGIQADVMGAMTGQSSGSIPGMGGGGMPSLGSITNAITGGFNSIQWTGAGGAQAYGGTGFANAATSGTGSTGFMGGSMQNFSGATGLASAGAGIAGSYVGGKLAPDAKHGDTAAMIGGAAGTFFGGPVGAAIGSAIAAPIAKGIFGGDWQTKDAGLKLAIEDSELDATQFERQRKSGGLFSGSSYRTGETAIDSDLQNALQETLSAQDDAIRNSLSALGIQQDAFDGFNTAVKKISTKGMDSSEVQSAIEDWVSGTVESAVSSIKDVSDFSREGENSVDTLSRLSTSLAAVNPILERLHDSAYNVSLAGADMASSLVDAFGGIENLNNLQTSYYQDFFSEAERANNLRDDLTEGLQSMGLSLPETREGFRELVEAQDLTTESGRKYYSQLLSLSRSFAEIVPVTEEVEETVSSVSDGLSELKDSIPGLKDNVRDLYETFKDQSFDQQIELLGLMGDGEEALRLERERELQSIEESLRPFQERIWALQDEKAAQEEAQQASQDYANELSKIQSNLQSTLTGISEWIDIRMATQQSPTVNLEESQKQFQEQLALAQGGDRNALQGITQYADRLINAGQGMFASGVGFQDIESNVISALENLPDAVSAEEFLAQEFRDALQNSITSLGETLPDQIGSALAPMFDNIDLNGDNLIDWNEFRSAFKGLASDERLKQVFNAVDVNGDGTISKLESLNASSDDTKDNTKSLEERAYDQLNSLNGLVNEMTSTTDQFVTLNTTMMSLKDSINALGVAQDEQSRIEKERLAAEKAEQNRLNEQRRESQISTLEEEATILFGKSSDSARSAASVADDSLTDKRESNLRAMVDRHMGRDDMMSHAEFERVQSHIKSNDAFNQDDRMFATRLAASERQSTQAIELLDKADKIRGQAFATGGAFTNGVVSQPTAFNMGLMGEAGPEAIMPLTNVGGQMGVRAILPESSPTMDFALSSAIRELKSEIRDLRRDSNERLDRVEAKADESNAIDREGYLALIARLQQSNELLSDMEESTTLNRSRD